MNPEAQERADALLLAIARNRRDAGREPLEVPAEEPGDAERVAHFSAAVLATLPAAPQTTPARRSPAARRGLAWAAVLVAATVIGVRFGDAPPPDLPAYQLEIAGADAAMRGPPAPQATGRATVTVGNRLLIVLRPEHAVAIAVAGALLRVDGERTVRLPTPVAASTQGALFVDAVIGGDLVLPPGPHRLWLIAHDERIAPEPSRLVGAASPVAAPGLHAVAIDLQVLAAPGAPP